MHRAVARGCDDLVWSEADALIRNFHSAITGTGCDLLCAVGMPIQTRFAHQKRQLASQSVADRRDLIANLI